jgi:ribosomal protein L7/L12
MDLTYLLIAAAILALPTLLTRLFSGDSGDTKIVLGTYTPARKPGAKPRPGASLRERVQALVAQRRIAEAVKLVRSAGNLAPAKAQEIVATMQRAGTAPSRQQPAPPNRQVDRDMIAQARQLVAQGEKVEAIKLIRQRTGMGLKEAIALADRLG